MSSGFAESHVEEAALAWLSELGYVTANGLDIGPDGDKPERASYGDVLLVERLRAAIAKLNPTLNAETRAEVLAKLTQTVTPSLVEENRRLHRYMIEGVPVEVRRADGSISGEQARLIDFDDPDANDWLAVNQYTVIENKANRRPDVVIFVNGMPLGVVELKNPGDENATLDGAFNQLQTYKSQITSLFRTNAVLVISDGIAARIGSLTADRERFMPWRTVAGDAPAAKGTPELETVLKGVFDRRRFLDLVKDFIVFGDTGSDVAKILAGYHQFHAVRKAVESTLSATAAGGDRKVGVIWHTQGSGKSLLMAFYAGQIIKHPAMQNPTLVVLTDRNDLDDQLFGTFSMCKDLLRQTPQQAEDREHLRKLLDRPSGGVIFTTLQKFSPEDDSTDYPALTDRRNVIVIADEAHRSQYGFRAKVEGKTGNISYGFAKYLRDGLPNASFIGFTGTPIEADDVNTPAVFGDYIDIYDISRAVEDGATVPIYYESRLARIELDESREAEDRRRDRRPHRGRGCERTGTPQAKMGECRGAGRFRQAARLGCRRPREAFRGPGGGARRQGDDCLHEPAHLRGALRRHREVAPAMAQRRRRGRRDQGGHDGGRVRSASVATAYRQAAKGAAGTDRQAREECGGPSQAGDRPRHVADRLRRALYAHDVCGQADEGPRADAGHRPRQPRLPRQAGGAGGGLHRHSAEPQERARAICRPRRRTGWHRRSRSRSGAVGEV